MPEREASKLSRSTGNSRSADLAKNAVSDGAAIGKAIRIRSGKEWGETSRSLARVVIFQDGKDCVSIRRVGRNFEYQSFFVIYDENEEVIDTVKCSREISSIGHAC